MAPTTLSSSRASRSMPACSAELDRLASGFAADWLWFDESPPEETAVERTRYAAYGFKVNPANVRLGEAEDGARRAAGRRVRARSGTTPRRARSLRSWRGTGCRIRGIDDSRAPVTEPFRRESVLCASPSGLHRLSYVEWGDPANERVLVCVHGLTRCARDFDALAAGAGRPLSRGLPRHAGPRRERLAQEPDRLRHPDLRQ